MFSWLDIGHADYLGEQFVYCKPFRSIHGRETRMDNVFFIVSSYRPGRLYGRVVLMFKMTVRTDSGELKDVECAMIDVYYDYAEDR